MKNFMKRVFAAVVILALAAAPLSTLALTGSGSVPERDGIWDGSVAGGFAGGTGTEADPYLISNGAQLAYLAQQANSGVNYEGFYFELTNDIYLNDTTDWESWGDGAAPANEWTPIGTGSWNSGYTEFNYPFSGSFDGNGCTVYGVYVNEPESDYHGLFGYSKSCATIANIGVSESYISGNEYVGGVVGDSDGNIFNCRNTGSVIGAGYVGGVVGGNWYGELSNSYNTGSIIGNYCVGGVTGGNWYGEIINCYNTGSVVGYVTGNVYIGGVVGSNGLGGVSNCYNTGSVTGELYVGGVAGENWGNGDAIVSDCYNIGSVTGSECIGGVVGSNEDTITDCYYLDTCCDNGTEYGAALTDAQMQEAGSFVGFDFAEVWTMEGNASYPYPELISNPHGGASAPVPADGIWDGSIAGGFAGGTGTEADPYLISNGAELAYLAQQVNSGTSYAGSCFELTNDICLNDTTGWESWGYDVTPANEWTAIGRGFNYSTGADETPFSGSFDGNGHTVSGIYINADGECHGLFGYLGEGGTIANVEVCESYVSGYSFIGCVVGENHGSVIGCRNNAVATGDFNVGGVVGKSFGPITDCSNAADLTGGNYVGGVVGSSNYGDVIGCYNTGDIVSDGAWGIVGGVAGESLYGDLINCYNTGDVTGETGVDYAAVGGVVGENFSADGDGDDANIINCYNTGTVTGVYSVGGVAGANYSDRYDAYVTDCYNTGEVIGEHQIGGIVGWSYTVGGFVSISKCYNAGEIIGFDSLGGVVGWAFGGGSTIEDCYYLNSTCGSEGNEYGMALTDAQMREAGSFVGFDFAEVWTMEGNASYPYPELIDNPHVGAEGPAPVTGDVNGDGSVTQEDALLVLRMALGLDTLDPNGDVNGDGAVTPDDALVILRWALGL